MTAQRGDTSIRTALHSVLDPETHLSVVEMGLVRDVKIIEPEESRDKRAKIYISYTLTTPGCPLAGTIQSSLRAAIEKLLAEQPESWKGFESFDPQEDIYTELTFDPPWSLADMSEEARAELGF